MHNFVDLTGIVLLCTDSSLVTVDSIISENALRIVKVLCLNVLVVFNLPPLRMRHRNFLPLIYEYSA